MENEEKHRKEKKNAPKKKQYTVSAQNEEHLITEDNLNLLNENFRGYIECVYWKLLWIFSHYLVCDVDTRAFKSITFQHIEVQLEIRIAFWPTYYVDDRENG